MKQFLVLAFAFVLFTTARTAAQTSGPRKPPTSSNRQASAQVSSAETEDNTKTNKGTPPESRTVNALDIVLKKVKGSVADQTVSLEMLITNPKGNSEVSTSRAEAFDLEGDKYIYPPGGAFLNEVLYTDVPRRTFVRVAGVPSKIKSLRLFKFTIWNQHTGQDVVVEFRNLEIEW